MRHILSEWPFVFRSFLFAMLSCIVTNLTFATENSLPELLNFTVNTKSVKAKEALIGLAVVGSYSKPLRACVSRLKKDLEWSGQCLIQEKSITKLVHVSDLQKMFSENVSVAIFISHTGVEFIWRLYDIDNNEMIAGKKIDQADASPEFIAHMIADEVWPVLFNNKSSFGSKIAFCKQIWRKKYGKNRPYKQIWIADFDGTNQKLFVDDPTVSFAPRWNNDPEYPLLFYSENTLSNTQLVMSNMYGKRKVIYSFDGLNMQPTFSDDGKRVVMCLSKDGTSQLYLSYFDVIMHQRRFDRLTFNDSNNIAPCFVSHDQVAFVSDFQSEKPQIYIVNIVDKKLRRITDGGYCVCPNFSLVRKQLVYCKMIGGAMQLFTYDIVTGKHRQMTTGGASKEEPSWSACGNYIVFGANEGQSSRIAQLNVITKAIKFLTSNDEQCTYPDYSPIYHRNIGILQG